jgi:hypothetical protein
MKAAEKVVQHEHVPSLVSGFDVEWTHIVYPIKNSSFQTPWTDHVTPITGSRSGGSVWVPLVIIKPYLYLEPFHHQVLVPLFYTVSTQPTSAPFIVMQRESTNSTVDDILKTVER